ncbi:polycystin-1-like protein 2 isoform X1 [Lethenteron reissneri]|uniref:polycystin-1-like protein 2 isoform X1 n=6 Tax=Lethenteron reissneri TaxID=7753 RepID=UPI002AB77901|nr:polycystin-1-like protein 2 isoform X1 [Lethenteron reissneri]
MKPIIFFVVLVLASFTYHSQLTDGITHVITKLKGSIASPNYPYDYPSLYDGYWVIVGPPDSIITLTIVDQAIGWYDSMTIYENDIAYKYQYFGNGYTLKSIGNSLIVHLGTSLFFNNRGFYATYTVTVYPDDYKRPIGLKMGNLSDALLTASSEYNANFSSKYARLDNMLGFWRPKFQTSFEYLQIVFPSVEKVTGLILQGSVPQVDARYNLNPSWVKAYTLDALSPVTLLWWAINVELFPFNSDSETPKYQYFYNPLVSSGLRIRPTQWHDSIALRMEVLLKCSKNYPTEVTYKVMNLQGLVKFEISNALFCGTCYLWDFGDNHTVIQGPNNCNKWLLSSETIPYTSDLIELSYNYSAFGMYHMVVQEINNVTNTYEKNIYVNSYGCVPEDVTLVDDVQSTNKTGVLRISKAMDLVINLILTCMVQYNEDKYIWSIKNLQTGNIKIMPGYDAIHQRFDPLYFTGGTFLIEVAVNLSSIYVPIMKDNLTVIVQPTPLEVYITGGDTRTVSNGADVQVDASELSYDPDDVSQSNTGIVFQWKCTKTSPNNVTANCKFSEMDSGTISIPQSELEINAVILAEVTATKDARKENRTQALQIKGGGFVDVYISCVGNCNMKTTTTEPLVLSVRCANCVDGEIITYHWKMDKLTDVDFEAMTSTGIYSQGLVVTEDSLEKGKQHEISVQVEIPNKDPAKATYMFETGSTPTNGSCTSDLTSGIAGVTFFKLSCENWLQDGSAEETFSYSYTARSGNTEFNLFSTHLHQTPNLLLPAGDLDAQGLLDLQANVCNSFGACSSASILVNVTRPSVEILKNNTRAMLAFGGKINDLVLQGSALLPGILLTVFASLENTSVDPEINELQKELIKIMMSISVPLQNKNSISQLASSLNSIVSYSGPSDQNALINTATTILQQMKVMRNVQRKYIAKVITDIFEIGANAFQMQLNLQSDVNDNQISSFAKNDSYLKNTFDNAYNTLLLIGEVESKNSVSGEKAVTLNGNNMSLVMQTVSEQALLNSTWKTVDGSDASLIGTNSSTFLQLKDKVNVQVCSFVENPFLWDKKSPVNSSVVSLKISIAKKRINVTSAIIKVTNQRIVGQEISLPVLTTNDTVQGKAFVNANSGMVIMLDFLPTSDILNEVELLLRFEQQPEFEPLLYDFSFVVNSSTSGSDKLHQSLNTGGFGLKNKMVNSVQALPRFFIPSNATQVGVYHIAALYTGSDKKLVINKKVKINAWTLACKSRDISVNEWKYTSAQVHPNSTRDMTVCVVGGNQSAGDINFGQQNVFIAAEFLTPNLIDFTSVFTKFDLETNGAVFATVTVIVLLYIIVLLWARNQDIQDQDKNKVFYLSDLDGDNKCWLLLRVKTVSEEDSGTQSCAYFNLYFHESELGTRELAHPDLKEFETGITYNFIFSMPENYGTPSHIKLWLKGNNPCDCWNISELSVFDQENEHVYFFVDSSLPSSRFNINYYPKMFKVRDESFLFSNKLLVNTALKGNFSDSHLWFSVFIRPFKTNFSRVHRISCCITLLFLMMIVNAMWFGKKQAANEAGGGVAVGPLSLTDVLISLLSSLVEVPVSLVVVLIFRNSRSESERPPGQKSSWRGPWPGGCRCVAWCLVVLAVLSSGFFTILYSMEWGPEKANRWLIRFFSSFLISVILVQPMKNIVSAFGKYLLWKKAKHFHNREIIQSYVEVHSALHSSQLKEPSFAKANCLIFGRTLQRLLRLKILFSVLYLVPLFFVAYTHVNGSAIHFKTNTEKTFITRKFETVADILDYWDWVSNSILPYMIQTHSSTVAENNYLNKTKSFEIVLIGLVQLRQKRYTKAPSEMNYVKMLEDVEYFPPERDTSNYTKAWVKSNIIDDEKDKYWIYQNLEGESTLINFDSLGSDGYLVDLINDAANATDTLAYLKENSWLDSRTAALTTELTVFNANTNLLCHINLLLGFSPSGVATPQGHLAVFSIHMSENIWFVVTMAAYTSISVLSFFLLGDEILKFKKEKMAYFSNAIHFVEITSFVLRITLVTIYYKSYVALKETLLKHTQDGNVTFGKLASLDECLRAVLALLVFVESLKVLQLLHRGARWCLALPLLCCETRIKSRLLLLVVLLCAYSLSLHGLYGARSWAHSFQSVTSALLRMSRLGEALGGGGACATLAYLSFRLLSFLLLFSPKNRNVSPLSE